MENGENVVYYSGFWYSAFAPIGQQSFSVLLNEKRILDRIKADLRLLSLIFDVIHIPRSHLLTFHTSPNWSVLQKFLTDKDFFFMTEHRIILSSSLPYTDEYSDTQRIVDRVKDKGWSAGVDHKFIKAVEKVEAIRIDSARESKNNVDIFQEYISLLKGKNQNIAHELDEIRKRSNYKTVPFLHEMFIEELYKSDKIDAASKEDIWRYTNSMYISTGCLDLGEDRRISFNGSIEHRDASHDNTGIMRELYSPQFIETLIAAELGDSYLLKFLNHNVDSVMKFRRLKTWNDFKFDVFEMFETITQIEKIKPEEFAMYKGHQKLLAYKKYIVGEDGDKFSDLIAELIVIAAESTNPIAGKAVKGGRSIIAGMLVKKYSDWKVSQKIHTYKTFWKHLKIMLDEIN